MALTAEREELQHFLSMSHNTSKIYGTEPIPEQMLTLSYIGVVIPLELHGFLCEWYASLYERKKEDVLEYMDQQVNQYGRLQISAKIFGSMISGRQEKNTTILAKWIVSSDESSDTYSGEV